jgi:hypothetical protein
MRTASNARATSSVAGMRWLFAMCDGSWPTARGGVAASYQ